jgi:hypothetical protein
VISLCGIALGAPLVHPEPAFRWAVGSDPHLDWDLWQGQDTTRLLFNAAVGAMDADGVLILGDLYGARKSDLNGDRVWDCTVDRRWDGVCEYPGAYLGQKYRDSILVWDPLDTRPDLWLTGNHDGHVPQPTIASLDTVDEWERTWLRPDDQPCLVERGREYARCDVIVASGGLSHAWTVLLLPDQTSHQDRAIGGRCDLRDYDGLTKLREGCSTYGWPTGVITPYQLEWVESQIALAQKDGRSVIVATHQPVPDTVALSSRASSYVPQCAQGILVQRPPPNPHFPRDADYLPARTDLDNPIPGDPYGRTPLDAAQEYVGSVVRWYPGQSPDDTWGLDLVRRYPGVVRVWLSGHNHVPVPDLVDHLGRGMVHRDPVSGTAFLASGAITRYWLSTSGTGHPMAGTLDLGANGTWTWTRWSIQSHASGVASHGCGTPAALPPTRPAPWVGVPVESGP